MADTIKNILMIILLIIGMYLLMRAKVDFQRRQQKVPDNAWSPRENLMRRCAYGIFVVDVVIALFIRV